MSLPYLLQSLVSANGATCVQPRPGGTVHHYPRPCNVDRSSTTTTHVPAAAVVVGPNGAGPGRRVQHQCGVVADSNNAAVYHGAPVQVKKEIKTEEGKENLS